MNIIYVYQATSLGSLGNRKKFLWGTVVLKLAQKSTPDSVFNGFQGFYLKTELACLTGWQSWNFEPILKNPVCQPINQPNFVIGTEFLEKCWKHRRTMEMFFRDPSDSCSPSTKCWIWHSNRNQARICRIWLAWVPVGYMMRWCDVWCKTWEHRKLVLL